MDGDPTTEQPYTMQQFADRVGVSYQTVGRWVREGRIVHYQPGGRKGRVLIPRSALDQSGPGLQGPKKVDGIARGKQNTRSGPIPSWMEDDAAW